jgi:hypothetical protein
MISRKPNHILLDYYDSNGLAPFNFAASINGVSAPTNTVAAHTPTVSPTATGALASGASSGSDGSQAVVETSRLNGGGRMTGELSRGIMVALGGVLGGLMMGVMGVMP